MRRRHGVTMILACALMLTACSTPAVLAEPTPTATPTATPTPVVSMTPAPITPDAGEPPARVSIAAIGLDAEVVPVGAPDQVLEVPDDPWIVGWWHDGVGIGATHGTTVMVAHIRARDYGTGPLARAPELQIGAPAQVVGADGTIHEYVVARVDTYKKTVLPYAELFRQEGAPRVMLVTCGGEWDAAVGHYDSNVTVELSPVG